jgi:hypothetical protein
MLRLASVASVLTIFDSQRPRSGIGSLLAVLFAVAAPIEAAANPPQAAAPIEITGQYTIHFNGFNIGDVRLEQRLGASTYSASSDVTISALLGAFHWKGMTRASGTLSKASVLPSGYDFRFSGSANSGAVRINFDDAGVSELEALPVQPDPPDFVPLRRPHIKGVVDPLSALVSLTRPLKGHPCGRKLALFDGKQRFDVALQPIETSAPNSAAGNGGESIVCRIRYTPIAGYRNTVETRSLAENDGMQVAFRHVPRAQVWVAQRVTLPTLAGSVTIEAQRIDISSASGPEVALAE